jgi:hypothetical protein
VHQGHTYTSVIPVILLVSGGGEAWSVAVEEEHRRGMFENGAVRKTCGPTREEGRGDWKELHNGGLPEQMFR